MKHYIYKVTNKTNKKIYIGQTINTSKRWNEHRYDAEKGSNTYFHKAIRKYGIEGFDWEVIDSCNSMTVDSLETEYILKFKSLKPKGYNLTVGGEGNGTYGSKAISVYSLSGEFIETVINASYYELKTNGKYSSRSIRKCCKDKKNRYKDLIFRFENDEKPQPYVKPVSTKRLAIDMYSINGSFVKSFDSIANTSKVMNINRTSIISCLTGKNKTSGGYVFVYKGNKVDFDKSKPSVVRGIAINQLDDDRNIIASYISCKEAEKVLDLRPESRKVIWKYLDKNVKVYGYYWERQSCAKP